MARRFRGEWVHKVDQKGRVSIPAPFRRVLEEGDPDWAQGLSPNLVLIYGRRDKPCMMGFSLLGIETVEDEFAETPRFSREREAVERMLSTKSAQLQLDENGRIVLSSRLREMFGIGDEALFAGMTDHFELWAPNAFEKYEENADEWMASEGLDQNPYALLHRIKSRGRS